MISFILDVTCDSLSNNIETIYAGLFALSLQKTQELVIDSNRDSLYVFCSLVRHAHTLARCLTPVNHFCAFFSIFCIFLLTPPETGDRMNPS